MHCHYEVTLFKSKRKYFLHFCSRKLNKCKPTHCLHVVHYIHGMYSEDSEQGKTYLYNYYQDPRKKTMMTSIYFYGKTFCKTGQRNSL